MRVPGFSCSGKLGIVAAVASLALLTAQPAAAYVGPGAGLSAIGVLLALVGTLLLAIVGFVWYPLKRLLRKAGPSKSTRAPEETDPQAHR